MLLILHEVNMSRFADHQEILCLAPFIRTMPYVWQLAREVCVFEAALCQSS